MQERCAGSSEVRRRWPGGVRRRGFTLIETAMALVIIGVGVVAVVDAQFAFIRSNQWSSQAATGTLLAAEIREMMRSLPRHDPVTGFYVDSGTPVGWGPELGEVTALDYDDVDDFDQVVFGEGGDFPGPIDAVGQVIPQLTTDGLIETDPVTGQIVPLRGWRQIVNVEKVDPFNYGLVRPIVYEEPAAGNFQGRPADRFPLRVTVIVTYQSEVDPEPMEITRLVWIVP